MLLSHVMLSMYFMHTLLGNASLSDDIPIIYFFPRQMSPVLLVKLLHSGILRLIQSPPDGLIRLFLHLHVLGMLFFRGFATIGFLVLYLFLLFPKVLSVFLLGPSRPSTHLRRLQTYILALSADTINSLPFTFVNFDVDTYDVAFDNCTSYCVTNDKADYIFDDYVASTPGTTPIQGVGGSSAPLGFGTVAWRFRDDNGLLHTLKIPHVAYLQDCPVRLCCPQALSQDVFCDGLNQGTYITTYEDHSILVFDSKRFQRTIQHPPCSGIPILSCGPGLKTFREYFDGPHATLFGKSLLVIPEDHSTAPPAPLPPDATFLPTSVVPIAPLTAAQLELLRLHARMGHMHMSVIQTMLRRGQIRTKVPGIANCRVPKCAACLYAKISRKPWRTNQPPGSVKDSLMVMPCLLPQGDRKSVV